MQEWKTRALVLVSSTPNENNKLNLWDGQLRFLNSSNILSKMNYFQDQNYEVQKENGKC